MKLVRSDPKPVRSEPSIIISLGTPSSSEISFFRLSFDGVCLHCTSQCSSLRGRRGFVVCVWIVMVSFCVSRAVLMVPFFLLFDIL